MKKKMKKIITLITITFLVYNVSFAQNTIAKLKYEEAEEAYSLNNYELTLSKIKEVEVLLKSTNPKLLYLEIKAQTKIIEQNPENDYAIIENTRTSVEKYLKDYDNIPDNEDKYRDIYKISEQLPKYPKSKIEFDNITLQRKQDELNAINEKKNESKRVTDSILKVSRFKLLITKEEFVKLYPESQSIFSVKRYNKGKGYYRYVKTPDHYGFSVIDLDKNIVVRYKYIIKGYHSEYAEGDAAFQKIAKCFDENLVFIPTKSSSSSRTYKIKKEDEDEFVLSYSNSFLEIEY